MSANPKPDLQEVKSKFESFRASRTGKERLPDNLWAAAVALLDHYPFDLVWRELRVKPAYLKRHATKGQPAPVIKRSPKFLKLRASELTAINNGVNKKTATPSAHQPAECRLVIERVDGSRLTLNLPIDWSRIETLCASFLRG